ncbi:hypothetical protein [Flavobacterium sp.]|uniref:hypothetical protein n=1 Tax=Flavobacterium sp. TaxID=239 RepID=UPI0025BE5762|nr:hypothetical protein [Flavobacterium sp.]
MTNDEIIKTKDELMSESWTEDLHLSLQDFHPDVARKIVDSMDLHDVYLKVNQRAFQEDYIADYLEYLWDISENAYWTHISISLDPEVGLLWSDNMSHLKRLCMTRIPADILMAVVLFLINDERNIYQDTEAIGFILKAQVEKFDRLEEIISYIKCLKLKNENNIIQQVEELIKKEANYNFYR